MKTAMKEDINMDEKKVTNGGFSTFKLAYSVGWVIILLKLIGVVNVAWVAVAKYFIILAFAYAIIFTLIMLIGIIVAAVTSYKDNKKD